MHGGGTSSRRAAALALGALLASAAGVGSGYAGAEPAARVAKVREVAVGSNFYDPRRLTVARGQRVRWVWDVGIQRHSVTVRRGPQRFDSRLQSSGIYSRRFSKPGTFKLYCTEHPSSMRMTLVVRR